VLIAVGRHMREVDVELLIIIVRLGEDETLQNVGMFIDIHEQTEQFPQRDGRFRRRVR